ncbi:Calcyclin-binding protein cacybp [Globisporangium polare]
MARDDNALSDEVAELHQLLAQAKAPGNVRDLTRLLNEKQQALAASAAAVDDADVPMENAVAAAAAGTGGGVKEEQTPVDPVQLPAKQPVTVHAVKSNEVGDLNVYTEISRFGWEDEGYGKDKVSVYVMSGIDDVGDLPKENVACTFTKSSFDLKILGLHEKNYRLVKTYLDKDIVPAKSSFRVKKNRVTISLWKADKNHSWMNLTEKSPGKSLKTNTTDPAAGIMDMMKNMYDEGDEEMKRTIAKAWTESQQKNAAAGF